MTIEISLIDLIFRGVVGIGMIIVFILIINEQRKTEKILKEDAYGCPGSEDWWNSEYVEPEV